MLLFSGCSKNVGCNIERLHAHNYVADNSFSRFIVSEKEKNNGLIRTDKYIFIDEEEQGIRGHLNQKVEH